MIRIIWLDKAVLRQRARFAVIKKLIVSSEQLRLVLEQVDYFQTRTRRIEVINFCRVARIDQTFVDIQVLLVVVKDVHAHLTERGSIVGESAVAERRSRNGREPSI